jgi:hypothetical protein
MIHYGGRIDIYDGNLQQGWVDFHYGRKGCFFDAGNAQVSEIRKRVKYRVRK